jgi:hypothetical protein
VKELILPAFEMDCRHWLVSTPGEVGLPDELHGAPLLAVLTTLAIAGGTFREVGGTLTMGLFDRDLSLVRPVEEGAVAREILDSGPSTLRQYVLPAPDGRLALLAEFELPEADDLEMLLRVQALMASFRWAEV